MPRAKLQELLLTSLFIALVALATMVIKIPVVATNGYINVGDTMIFVGALLFGRRLGFLAGSFGSAFADILLGYAHFAPITFVVKGLEGWLVGALAHKGFTAPKTNFATTPLWLALGGAVMVAGYFIAEVYLFGYAAALAEVLGNTVQAVGSIVLSLPLAVALKRANVLKFANRPEETR